MEIHPPIGAVHTVKDFFVHLSMIVIGILIAVSLEQIVEWRHHAKLVSQAHENIISELRDNARELDGTMSTYPETEKELVAYFATIRKLHTHKPLKDLSVRLNFHLSQLSSASRSSAEATGALGYMNYEEVKRYAAVYDLQQQFLRVQERLLEATTLAIGGVRGDDPAKASDAELDVLNANAKAARAQLTVADSIGRALKKEYEKALKPER